MSKPENTDLQETIKHKFESWQSQYYKDVYALFEKRDEQRLAIAFSHWDDRFIIFLHDEFPRLAKSYEIQAAPLMPWTSGLPIENFKPYISNQIEAFLAQCIEDAKKGNLNQYYIAPNESPKASQASSEEKSALQKFLTFIFIIIPKTIGRLFFDIFGKGDKAAPSSTIIAGYIVITVVVLLLLRVVSPNALINIYRSFVPEPK